MTQPSEQVPVKAMVSYAWGSDAQQARVRQLVDQLIGDGIEVIFDRYHLQDGDDANAFMEQVAARGDVRKVIAICDPKYVARMNSRQGGSGQEGMIMSPHVYEQLRSAAGGDQGRERKFIAVIFDRNPEIPRDDPGHLPTMFGSMKYIDMSTPEDYDKNYDQLLRFLLGKPEFVAPPLGKVPEHLQGPATTPLPGVSQVAGIRRAIDQGRDATPAWRTYLSTVIEALRGVKVATRVDGNRSVFDFDVMQAEVERLKPLRDQFVEILQFSTLHNVIPTDLLIEFFEAQLDLSQQLSNASRDSSGIQTAPVAFAQADFLLMELFLYASTVLTAAKQIDALKALTEHTYFEMRNYQLTPVTFGNFQQVADQSHIEGEYRRVKAVQYTSALGAWLMDRATLQTVPVELLLATDLLLFLKSMSQRVQSSEHYGYRWGCLLGPYLERRGVPPLLNQWVSRKRLSPWLAFFDVDSTDALRQMFDKIFPDRSFGRLFRSGWADVNVNEFFQTEQWGALP